LKPDRESIDDISITLPTLTWNGPLVSSIDNVLINNLFKVDINQYDNINLNHYEGVGAFGAIFKL